MKSKLAIELTDHLLIVNPQATTHDLIEQQLVQALETNDSFELTEEHFAELDRKLQELA